MQDLKFICFFFLIGAVFGLNAQGKKINIVHSDQTYRNELKYPGAIVLNGQVEALHEGAVLKCKKALYYRKENLLHAFGNVRINQGDTLHQTSDYVRYNGFEKKAVSWGNVVITDPKMTLQTDTLYFDRAKQTLFYKTYATIKDQSNELQSKEGRYNLVNKKFAAQKNVLVKNSENQLKTENLDYDLNTGHAYFYGFSTLTTPESTAFAERGYYHSKTAVSRLVKNAKIHYENRVIEGDSIYNNRAESFASATGNIVLTDTVNNTLVKGGYAELFQEKDSVFVIKNPLAILIENQDSLYIHGDTLLITGKPERRILRAYHHVKILKRDLSGKCDSLYTNQQTGLTEMFKNPVLWSENNQITGDSIQLLSHPERESLDSLFIKRNAFIVQEDAEGYSQIKGKNMYGKFENNKLKRLLSKGNGEVINYIRDESQNLIGILKMTCSNLLFQFKENGIDQIQFLTEPDGITYPPADFPDEQKKLKGFQWRGKERPLQIEDLFKHDAFLPAIDAE